MTTYIAIGPYCWGKATSIKQAIANAKKEMPGYIKRRKPDIKVYEVHPDTTVSGMGGFVYPREHAPKEVTLK